MKVQVVSVKSPNFKKDLLDSVTNTGFVVLTDHDISENLIRSSQQQWKSFFESRLEQKEQYLNPLNGNLGYKGKGSEKAVGAKVADLKEFFHWKPGHTLPGIDDLTSNTIMMYSKLSQLSSKILNTIDEVNPGTTYEKDCAFSDNTLLRTLYYPALNDCALEPGAVRAAAHEDINFITLLVAASSPGLQVKDKIGNWHDVPHEQNSITVNIGDMLQLASKGAYKSTTHRVINPTNASEPRISMPLFIHPHSNVILSPGFTAQQYLNQRIAEIYQAGK